MSGDAISTVRGVSSASPSRRRSLLIIRGAEIDVRALPVRGEVTIGRGSSCEIQIDAPSLSRSHLRLVLEDAAIRITDLGSANGTAVGGVRILPQLLVEVSPNDPIAVGDVVLVIQDVRASRAAPARGAAAGRPSGAVARSPAAPIVVDPAVRRIYELASRLARGQIGVLITGETGVGKDVLAEYLHRQSPRADGPLVRINCAALVDSLVEAELFGHERGGFTGAQRERRGLIEAASGGTVFLDEIGETSPAMQAKLLRVLEDRQVLRVGSTEPRPVDVRFVAATNRDLEAELETGGFRRDLYFRIAGAVLALPPLRDRPQEIEALARAFVVDESRELGREPPRLTEAACRALRAHAWAGNARELRNVIERAVLLCDGAALDVDALVLPAPPAPPSVVVPPGGAEAPLRDELEERERQRISAGRERQGGYLWRAA
ncbi:MAG: sigma 54-interacting transcriptional regulator, partial [Kofleriaceae bacterium]